eukprot:29081-Pelagococcus_subviridis.AAC.13
MLKLQYGMKNTFVPSEAAPRTPTSASGDTDLTELRVRSTRAPVAAVVTMMSRASSSTAGVLAFVRARIASAWTTTPPPIARAAAAAAASSSSTSTSRAPGWRLASSFAAWGWQSARSMASLPSKNFPPKQQPKRSSHAMWAAGLKKKKGRPGAKAWRARVLTKQARKAQKDLITKWKIYTGDTVKIRSGKDKGQVGVVQKVFRKENRLIVEGLNLVKKHVKRTEENKQGGVITMEAPIHYSNVGIVDPVTGAATRIGIRFLDDGTKVRVTLGRLASGAMVPKPDHAIVKKRVRENARNSKTGTRDTSWQDALRNTYAPEPEARGFFGEQ